MTGRKFMKIKFLTILFLTSTVMFGQVICTNKKTTESLVLYNHNNHINNMIKRVYSENKEIKQNTILILNVDKNPHKIKVTVLEKKLLKWYSKEKYRKIKGVCNINDTEILVYGAGYKYYFKKTKNRVDIGYLNLGGGEKSIKEASKPLFRPIIDPIVWVFSIEEDGFELEKKGILNPF